jgi:hypothetical protein
VSNRSGALWPLKSGGHSMRLMGAEGFIQACCDLASQTVPTVGTLPTFPSGQSLSGRGSPRNGVRRCRCCTDQANGPGRGPPAPSPRLESVRLPTRKGVHGRLWQVIRWPSTKPDRRLGPGRLSGPPPDRPGMQPFPLELEPPEADRALETIDASTDN